MSATCGVSCLECEERFLNHLVTLATESMKPFGCAVQESQILSPFISSGPARLTSPESKSMGSHHVSSGHQLNHTACLRTLARCLFSSRVLSSGCMKHSLTCSLQRGMPKQQRTWVAAMFQTTLSPGNGEQEPSRGAHSQRHHSPSRHVPLSNLISSWKHAPAHLLL